MNTRLKKFRARRPKVAKPIPPPKPPRARVSELKRIYRDLITSDVDQRVETLKKVVHWYERAVAYVSFYKAWSLGQRRAQAKAEQFRLAVIKSDKDVTKEEKLIEAIRQYEKMVMSKLHPPKINSYLSKYSKIRSTLVRRKRRMNNKFGAFLFVADEMLKPWNYEYDRIEMGVDKLSEKYHINSQGHITFDRKFLDTARRTARKQGWLPAIMIILPPLVEAASMSVEHDHKGHRTGRYVFHNSRKAHAWDRMMNNFTNYCLKNKIRIVRHSKVMAPTVKAAA